MRRVTLRAENADPVAAVARGLGLDHVGTIWAVIILHGRRTGGVVQIDCLQFDNRCLLTPLHKVPLTYR
jgi:hypothetical protein